MSNLTFRSSRIRYYGPHDCVNCGRSITKMADAFGGSSFNYPKGPIYPNTEWHSHVCDPADVSKLAGSGAATEVRRVWPTAESFKCGTKGWVITANSSFDLENLTVLSPNQTYYDTPWAAWTGAKNRQVSGRLPWKLDRTTAEQGVLSEDLMRLPECPPDGQPPQAIPLTVGSKVRFNPSTGNDTAPIYTIKGYEQYGDSQLFYDLLEVSGLYVRNSLVPVLSPPQDVDRPLGIEVYSVGTQVQFIKDEQKKVFTVDALSADTESYFVLYRLKGRGDCVPDYMLQLALTEKEQTVEGTPTEAAPATMKTLAVNAWVRLICKGVTLDAVDDVHCITEIVLTVAGYMYRLRDTPGLFLREDMELVPEPVPATK
jgi:hypothetical protein